MGNVLLLATFYQIKSLESIGNIEVKSRKVFTRMEGISSKRKKDSWCSMVVRIGKNNILAIRIAG